MLYHFRYAVSLFVCMFAAPLVLPEAPRAARVVPLSGTELQLQFDPPDNAEEAGYV